MKVRLVVVALVAALTPVCALATPASAATLTKTLTFDEIATRPVNGLHEFGIRFGFKVDGTASRDAEYDSVGPPAAKYVDGACLEGDATGVLTLTFDQPTKLLAFGLDLATTVPLEPGFTVSLFDHTGASLGTIAVNTKRYHGYLFSEARFKKTGVAIKRAVITFDGADAPRFALDNLTYRVHS